MSQSPVTVSPSPADLSSAVLTELHTNIADSIDDSSKAAVLDRRPLTRPRRGQTSHIKGPNAEEPARRKDLGAVIPPTVLSPSGTCVENTRNVLYSSVGECGGSLLEKEGGKEAGMFTQDVHPLTHVERRLPTPLPGTPPTGEGVRRQSVRIEGRRAKSGSVLVAPEDSAESLSGAGQGSVGTLRNVVKIKNESEKKPPTTQDSTAGGVPEVIRKLKKGRGGQRKGQETVVVEDQMVGQHQVAGAESRQKVEEMVKEGAGAVRIENKVTESSVKLKTSEGVAGAVGWEAPPAPPRWLVGDLVWARYSSFPWWPCVVTYDPDLGLYTQLLTTDRSRSRRYHVRYYGARPLRGWVSESLTLPFQGLAAFERHCAVAVALHPRRARDWQATPRSGRAAWDQAVAAADLAARLSRQDRAARLVGEGEGKGVGTGNRGKDELSGVRKNKRRSETGRNYHCGEVIEVGTKVETKKTKVLGDAPKLGGGTGSRRELVCRVCEGVGGDEMVCCSGPCLRAFHRACLGLNGAGPFSGSTGGPFTCDECCSGLHTCSVCKSADSTTQCCGVGGCGRFLHPSCALTSPLARVHNGRTVCIAHVCTTCALDPDSKPSANKGRMLQCLRCAAAYHAGGEESCLPAGTLVLAGGPHIICCPKTPLSPSPNSPPPNSSLPNSCLKSTMRVNVSWCFLCSAGGTLLCCERCPAAFHPSCLKVDPPEGGWECEDCVGGKRPLYGEIVWAKMGSFRWWPARICRSAGVPQHLLELSAKQAQQLLQPGRSFVIQFFGSYDYCWSSQQRVYSFQAGDQGGRAPSTTNKRLNVAFNNAVLEANAAVQVWLAKRESRGEAEREKLQQKLPFYKRILVSTSYTGGSAQTPKLPLDELPRCNCVPLPPDAPPTAPAPCGRESDCLNRMLMCECHPLVCPGGSHCDNRRFTLRQNQAVAPFRTSNGRGWGLKCTADIPAGEFVIEYVGELIDEEESRRRMKKAQEQDVHSFYMLTLDKNRIIDAGPRGNVSRFMNHSCAPNCETQKWTVNGDVRVGLFSLAHIPAGTELTFNYNLDCCGNEKIACQCGAQICSGYLGVPPKQVENGGGGGGSEGRKKAKRRKVVKPSFERQHEDECFRCGGGGRLLMCDKSDCPKAYHLACLGTNKPPSGKWVCPWHHCDACGRAADSLCSACDNSFCTAHVRDSGMRRLESGRLLCVEHDDDDMA